MLSLIPGTGVVVPASVMPVDNASRIPGDHVHIPTTPQQDAEIRAFIDNIRQHPGGYSLSGRNCTSFVKAALDAGSKGPNDTVLAPFIPVDPRQLMYFLHQTYPSPH